VPGLVAIGVEHEEPLVEQHVARLPPGACTRPRLLAYDDFPVERGHERHQPLDREAIELVVRERRHLRLDDAELFGRGGPGEPLAGDDLVDCVGEAQLGLALVGVSIAEVGEHISGATGDCRVVGLRRLSASCHSGPRNPDHLVRTACNDVVDGLPEELRCLNR
jgi:hypothetical protein